MSEHVQTSRSSDQVSQPMGLENPLGQADGLVELLSQLEDFTRCGR